ncbi:MAG: hypothetical protein FGM28_05795 [Limnohabitans sp.]|nr:hypothetical protein [Limnohabitans sp.]
MKYLVLAIVLVGLIALFRLKRRAKNGGSRPPSAPDPAQAMLPCQLCGLHVPQAEVVHGTLGAYCCEAHRQRAGDRAP